MSYAAIELNIPCPGGLSGGPVFRSNALPIVTGLVTDNLESHTTLDAGEEERIPGRVKSTEMRRVITYGVALRLGSLAGWLDEHIPSP
jgi:hypothetical protein